MHIGTVISLMILAASLVVWIFAAIQDCKFSKGMFILLLLTVLGSFVTFAYFVKPVADLSRHYELLDQMKQGGWIFAQTESQYASLFIYNTFAYLIAQNGNYALLQTIPLIVDFAVFLYIYLDILKHNRANTSAVSAKDSLFAFFLWICSFGLKLAITGIRCVLAVALCALAIYQECIRKKNKIGAIALYAIALFIHNFAVWVIIVRLLTIFKKKGIVAICLFLVLLSGETVFQFLYDNINNVYLRLVFKRFLDTFGGFQLGSEHIQESGTAFLLMWAGFILISIYLIYMSHYTKKYYMQSVTLENREAAYCNRIFNFCYTVGILGLPMAFNYLYMERYMYLVAWALLMVSYYYLKTIRIRRERQEKNFWIVSGMTLVCLFVVFFNDVYFFMVNYIGYYFLGM